tara:strand:- start:157 stop:513 length:357 start_codon:yes stop_codon:yes gene_type:complete
MDPMAVAGDWSSLGLIPFLIYMHLKAEKRQDRQEAKIDGQRRDSDQRFEMMAKTWQKQLNDMIEKHEAKEEAVRDRYDGVVAKLDRERKEGVDRLLEEMRQLQIKVDDMVRFIARPMR